MGIFRPKKNYYPEEQLELHKTALELKGIAINLQRTVAEFQKITKGLREAKQVKENNQGGK